MFYHIAVIKCTRWYDASSVCYQKPAEATDSRTCYVIPVWPASLPVHAQSLSSNLVQITHVSRSLQSRMLGKA